MALTITRPTRVEIDLDAIRANVTTFRNYIPGTCELMAVVKADAYGHGAEAVANAAIEAGAAMLGVAFVDEAVALREAGITAPILILGNSTREAMEQAIDNDIAFTVNDIASLDNAVVAAESKRKQANVHLKIDTGMGRLGFLDATEVEAHVIHLGEHPFVNVAGVFTHLACADEENVSHTEKQFEQFDNVVSIVKKASERPLKIHALNSAGVVQHTHMSHDIVRVGIGLYGLAPSPYLKDKVVLKPALSFKTEIVQVKEVEPGTTVSYGSTFTATQKMKIATLPVGYADGYNRLLSNRGDVLIQGKRLPIIGRVCMDQMMVDVSEFDDVRVGEEVVLYGKQAEAEISVDEVAAKLNTINYEVVCAVSRRVPRVYIEGGQAVKVVNRLVEKNR